MQNALLQNSLLQAEKDGDCISAMALPSFAECSIRRGLKISSVTTRKKRSELTLVSPIGVLLTITARNRVIGSRRN